MRAGPSARVMPAGWVQTYALFGGNGGAAENGASKRQLAGGGVA